MPTVQVALPKELNKWLLDLVDGQPRRRAAQIRALLYMEKNGSRGVQKMRVDDWKDIKELRREGKKALKRQVADKNPEAKMTIFFTPADVLIELKEKITEMGINDDTS